MPLDKNDRSIDRFVVVHGWDHCSLPYAFDGARAMRIRDVFFFDSCFAQDNSTPGMVHVVLPEESAGPARYTESEIAEIVRAGTPLDAPCVLGEICFSTTAAAWVEQIARGERGMGAKWEIQWDANSTLEIPADVEGSWLVFTPRIGGWWLEIRDRGVQFHPQGPNTATVLRASRRSTGCDTRYIISPGHCRAHTYCVYDRLTRVVSWHSS